MDVDFPKYDANFNDLRLRKQIKYDWIVAETQFVINVPSLLLTLDYEADGVDPLKR